MWLVLLERLGYLLASLRQWHTQRLRCSLTCTCNDKLLKTQCELNGRDWLQTYPLNSNKTTTTTTKHQFSHKGHSFHRAEHNTPQTQGGKLLLRAGKFSKFQAKLAGANFGCCYWTNCDSPARLISYYIRASNFYQLINKENYLDTPLFVHT